MASPKEIIFLFDVDNTLLDNDKIETDIRRHMECEFSKESLDRYYVILEELHAELGYKDYLGALQRYCLGTMCDPRLLMVPSFLVDYPFADRLYPDSLDVLKHVRRWGETVILSDGDALFQPRKIQRSGLWEAVDGRVLVCLHKEQMLDDVERYFPAGHYVMTDDKLHILTVMKKIWNDRLTTIWVRQGHYALDSKAVSSNPPVDLTIEHIGDLVNWDASSLPGISKPNRVQSEAHGDDITAAVPGLVPLTRQPYPGL